MNTTLIGFEGLRFSKFFKRWLSKAAKIANKNLTFTIGRQYIRIVYDGHSAYGFVDRQGRVLYPAAWVRPAINKRGSIYTDKPGDGAGKYSVLRMDELRAKK